MKCIKCGDEIVTDNYHDYIVEYLTKGNYHDGYETLPPIYYHRDCYRKQVIEDHEGEQKLLAEARKNSICHHVEVDLT